jgi:hypothetical protein
MGLRLVSECVEEVLKHSEELISSNLSVVQAPKLLLISFYFKPKQLN